MLEGLTRADQHITRADDPHHLFMLNAEGPLELREKMTRRIQTREARAWLHETQRSCPALQLRRKIRRGLKHVQTDAHKQETIPPLDKHSRYFSSCCVCAAARRTLDNVVGPSTPKAPLTDKTLAVG